MMRPRLRDSLRLVIFLLLTVPLFGQVANAQLVKETFPRKAFEDSFDEDKGNWRSVSTSDNLFLIQDGGYMIRRKNAFSGYSIFTSWKNKLQAFSIRTSIKLEDTKNEEASAGLIFMAQEDGSGAFVFEFNPKGQYRLKQLVGVNYKLLTGEQKTGGWTESDALSPAGQYNLLEIRMSKRNYDLYVNEKYLLSFTEIAYKSGDIGFSIGASSKARVDFIQVNEPDDGSNAAMIPSGKVSEADPSTRPSEPAPVKQGDTGNSTDVILKLVDQVSALTIENQQLRDSVQVLKKQLRAANRSLNALKQAAPADSTSMSPKQ